LSERIRLGLRGRKTDLVVQMLLSANGKALTLARKARRRRCPSAGTQPNATRHDDIRQRQYRIPRPQKRYLRDMH